MGRGTSDRGGATAASAAVVEGDARREEREAAVPRAERDRRVARERASR